jgi:hypothetical protein
MTDDPNKKQGQQPNQSGRQPGQPGQQNQEQPGQQRDKGVDDVPQKRPSQGGHDVERDEEEQDQGGQRRAS